MGRRKGDEDKLLGLVLLGLGVGLLYYLKTGLDRENNATLIPDAIEDRIDRVVSVLNTRFGKNWVAWSADVLKGYLQNTLPQPLVKLIDVVSAVEQESKWIYMAGDTKQQRAVTMAIAGGLA